jgi:hypothetical protein
VFSTGLLGEKEGGEKCKVGNPEKQSRLVSSSDFGEEGWEATINGCMISFWDEENSSGLGGSSKFMIL